MVKHHTHLLEKLRKKGWTEKELEYALYVMSQSHSHKSRKHKFLDAIMPWFLFISILAGNFIIMFTVVPLLVFMPNFVIYVILSLLGFCFGFLYEIIIRDLEHAWFIHHKIALHIIIPFIALIGGGFIFIISYAVLPQLMVFPRPSFVFATIYILSFITPLLLAKFFIYEYTYSIEEDIAEELEK
ncbi:MAG: hypothetical protein ACMXYA_00830 [Candidatus Woesearchaeota archaeon]